MQYAKPHFCAHQSGGDSGMLRNADSLAKLVFDASYDKKFSGPIFAKQGDKWRRLFAILKANLLFMFDKDNDTTKPLVMIIMEDCLVEPSDENKTGKEFSFSITVKSTGRVFELASLDFESMEMWVSVLTSTSMDFMRATRLSLNTEEEESKRTTEE